MKQDANKKAEGLRADIESLYPKDIPVTVSIGLTCIAKGKKSSLNSLIKAADKALYQAKKQGRNQVCLAELE